ncbi:MAG TPA: RidA family protein [Xanthomonadales bacterium]|nr:RidA family protein [Xanthomonadales bacterium]
MKVIKTDTAPKVVGPYSQAIVAGDMIFCSGQIGLDPATGEMAGDDIESQTNQVIKNLSAVLEEAGSFLNKVVKTTCYLKNMDDYTRFNEIYAKFFISNPARATIEVSKLPKDALVEIEAIAAI